MAENLQEITAKIIPKFLADFFFQTFIQKLSWEFLQEFSHRFLKKLKSFAFFRHFLWDFLSIFFRNFSRGILLKYLQGFLLVSLKKYSYRKCSCIALEIPSRFFLNEFLNYYLQEFYLGFLKGFIQKLLYELTRSVDISSPYFFPEGLYSAAQQVSEYDMNFEERMLKICYIEKKC